MYEKRSNEQSILKLSYVNFENDLANEIQQSTLPDLGKMSILKNALDIFADLDSAQEIGGDYYDLFEIENYNLCISIGDVSGKGLPAALFQMLAKTILKMRAMDGVSLKSLCEAANRQLFSSQTTLGHMFVTVWMCRLDMQTGELEYVNAGHEPPIIVKKDLSISLLSEVSGLPIAAYYNPKRPEKNRYILYNTVLGTGDTILLYTDGATEIRNKNRETLGRDGLIRLVQQYYEGTDRSDITMKGLISYLQRSLIQYGNHAERDDDIAFLGLRRL